jgi:hypothetical protein
VIAKTGLFFNKNKTALVPDTEEGRHKFAYAAGQEIAKEHEVLVKVIPSTPNKSAQAPDKKE